MNRLRFHLRGTLTWVQGTMCEDGGVRWHHLANMIKRCMMRGGSAAFIVINNCKLCCGDMPFPVYQLC